MNRPTIIFAKVFLLLVLLSGQARPEEASPILAAAWIEGEGEARAVVTALYLPAGAGPATVFAGFAVPEKADDPGGYGKIKPKAWREISVKPGEVTLARHVLGEAAAPSVLVRRQKSKNPVDVHELIDSGGDSDPGAVLFGRPSEGGPVSVDRHLARIGDRVALTVKAPDKEGFFNPETFEILRVARRIGIDRPAPDGPKGHVTVEWLPPEEEDPPARLLEGTTGENRIRSHFEWPGCQWASRHAGWMGDFYILEYLRPATLRFSIDTSSAKAAGRVSTLWRSYGAIAWESIWPNGVGGSSTNLDLPPLLLVPESTPVREVVLP